MDLRCLEGRHQHPDQDYGARHGSVENKANKDKESGALWGKELKILNENLAKCRNLFIFCH